MGLYLGAYSMHLWKYDQGFYVLVQLVPRMTYFSGEDVINQLAPPKNWVKRVSISAVLLGSLLGTELAGAASVGRGLSPNTPR